MIYNNLHSVIWLDREMILLLWLNTMYEVIFSSRLSAYLQNS